MGELPTSGRRGPRTPNFVPDRSSGTGPAAQGRPVSRAGTPQLLRWRGGRGRCSSAAQLTSSPKTESHGNALRSELALNSQDLTIRPPNPYLKTGIVGRVLAASIRVCSDDEAQRLTYAVTIGISRVALAPPN
jgi:hypothetical protein